MNPTKAQIKQLAIVNASYPMELVRIPESNWPSNNVDFKRIEVWRSKHFLVQVFSEAEGIERLSICTTRPLGKTWQPGITWDDLQRLKAECGRAEKWAVEIFPAQADLVNVANMRHLWILPEPPKFAWKRGK